MSKLRAYQSAATTNSSVDITEHLTLVRKLASMMISRLPASVELDDLVQVGMIGLIEAAQQFDPAQGVLFETFASQRIRGAMLDELRRLDWLPRQARRNAKQIEEAMAQLEQSLGHPPGEGEIAARLGLSVDEYQTMLFECKGHQLVYFEDFGHDDDEGSSTRMVEQVADQGMVNPFEILGESRFRSHLVAAIKELPERDQLVMSLYYEQELNLKEIGAVLNVTESRVCQLHSQAVARLRTKLKAWIG
ncbi:RNA polymerase sigma factor FliA [Laribacter hongkongensis]|uniref:RNA polymerase sigma factor FliA n=2 Tax=Laribacter hongkongensis TaxID=168471 RepID=C1D4I0_LARHH|nr:RNA polymerase sigma factor FliA [Laribacter hongkongensis]ACO73774.1 FliA1 [Laribacter hongkongensis HLHK9]MCG8995801.1 RNA polymerase sigma factor FliA [Laribacter hongkongensis]MCG9009961.1 RNA polymerase sigma factor FliA [Laribacter hongkongensis]MCG9022363.1 RNA polymerase sigma factor FliA [Laribacter hongkongensis]MCG9024484.1 RNA polymerase sigma factor FliA [Laribacter hongkongensis]